MNTRSKGKIILTCCKMMITVYLGHPKEATEKLLFKKKANTLKCLGKNINI